MHIRRKPLFIGNIVLFISVQLVSLFKIVDLAVEAKKIKPETGVGYKDACIRLSLPAVDLDNLDSVFQYLITKLNGQHSYCNKVHAVIKVAAKINGRQVTGENYFLFINKLKQKHQSVIGYTDEQVRFLLKATLPRLDLNFSCHKLILTLAMTGARVSSLNGVKVSDFKQVPNVDRLYYTVVIGKGKGNGYPYPVFLPRHVLDYLNDCSKEGDDRLTTWNPTQKSTFRNYCSAKLVWMLKQYGDIVEDPKEKELLQGLSIGTSIFHSLRKNFSVRLANEENLKRDGDSISMLLGQKPNTLAYKVYVLSDGTKFDNVLLRMAKAYAGTSLMNLELWK